jgi:hypothetical protein
MEAGQTSKMRDLVDVLFRPSDVLGAQLSWSRALNLVAFVLQPTKSHPYLRIGILCPEDPEVGLCETATCCCPSISTKSGNV